MLHPLKKTIVLLGFVLVAQNMLAQDVPSRFLHFYSYNFDYKINKKIKLRAGELFSFNSETYRMDFTQFKLGGTYYWNKKWSSDLLYKPMLFKGTTKDIWYHRLSANLTHRSKLFELPFKNSITAEVFSPSPRKHKYRFIYTAKLSFKNKVLPLRATPYLKYQLYYYLGGEKVDYYDETGTQLLATNSPDGFHRYRIGAGVRFRPAKKFYVTLYYIWQEEFNMKSSNNRELNILNQSQTRIVNPFNDYQVLGLSLSYSLK